MKDAGPEVFDAWIRQFVDEIVNVDTSVWEIFHRWNVINAVIDGQFLTVQRREDGTFIVEAKASTSEVGSEEKTSGVTSENASETALEPQGE